MHEAHPFGPRAVLALLLMAALCGAAGAAPGRADPKALARYDISYAQCEQQYAEMRGHRDEAYLNLYRVNPDAKALAQLDAVRQGAAYRAEQKRASAAAKGEAAKGDTAKGETAKGTAPAASAPLSKKLAQQCQGLWSESRKVEALRK